MKESADGQSRESAITTADQAKSLSQRKSKNLQIIREEKLVCQRS
jgi:hypothetical protein